MAQENWKMVTIQDANRDLQNVVQEIIDAHRCEQRISPAWIATEAMAKLDAEGLQQSNPLVYHAAHLQLRQIARKSCRKQFDDDDGDALDPAQQEMFPGLQSRYPAAHSGVEPSYVLRDAMSAKDVDFNVKRLRREGATKLGRARALEAWWGTREAGLDNAAGGGHPPAAA
jgi:hypothetical protein